jgi:acetoin utilization deacetylase AcuC-like enzyme
MASLPVFYDRRQAAANNPSMSPSAGKPALVVADWEAAGIPIEIRGFEPLSEAEIALAHDPAYVRAVLACERPNGFGNALREIADTLPWTTGSMAAAAAHAVEIGGFAVSPTSGFHHAVYNEGMAFCTFNGLVIAAELLRLRGLAGRIGILDLDMHYGNGSADILKQLGVEAATPHYSFGGDIYCGPEAEDWLRRLPDIVGSFAGCDLLLYQAGADPHVDDPLGGALTSAQLRERDRIVFRGCAELGLPVAWNLAGGYQRPIEGVLAVHRATLEECVAAMADRRG